MVPNADRLSETGTEPQHSNFLPDTFARVLFVRLCGFLAQSSDVSKEMSEAFFQALCQAVLDMSQVGVILFLRIHVFILLSCCLSPQRVAFEAVSCICAHKWSSISVARVLPVVDEVDLKKIALLPAH